MKRLGPSINENYRKHDILKKNTIFSDNVPEQYDVMTRQRILDRLVMSFEDGYRDPTLLYLGGRYALSLGMAETAGLFLNELGTYFCSGDQIFPGFVPVGLLQMMASSDDAVYQVVREKLERLLPEVSPDTAETIREFMNGHTGIADQAKMVFNAVIPPSSDIKRQKSQAVGVGLLHSLQELAATANKDYIAGNLTETRNSLEKMLLIDGDQPAVLRNLITISSEQKDIEAYERYWRRFVKVLLWRMVRNDEITEAWEDLRQFYTQVATVMDRECSKTINDTQAILKRSGFLPRWLEAVSALVWLDRAYASRVHHQTGLDLRKIQDGADGFLSMMRYWFMVFYPEFSRYTGSIRADDSAEFDVDGREHSGCLSFDPVLKLMSRFLEWDEFRFGLQSLEGPQVESVIAMAGFIAHIPMHRFLIPLSQMQLCRSDMNKPVTECLRDACAFPLQIAINRLMNNQAWQEIIDLYGPPPIRPMLAARPGMYIAFAYLKTERYQAALDMALEILPRFKDDDAADDVDSSTIFRNIIHADINFSEEDNFQQISNRCEHIKQKLLATSCQGPAENFKQKCIGEIDEILEQITVKQLLNEAVESAKSCIEKEQFNEARRIINGLPDKPGIDELKTNFLSQINQAQEAKRINHLIDNVIKEAKSLVEKGMFNRARQEVRRLPDQPDDVRQLKNNLFKQIDDAEDSSLINRQIDEIIEKSKKFVEKGQLDEARKQINRLPNRPDVQELKNNLFKQIDDVGKDFERYQKENTLIIQRMADKGINLEIILKIATENNLDISNPAQMNGLLKAFEKQL